MRTIFYLLFLCSSLNSYSQQFSGKVMDDLGSIPYAQIYLTAQEKGILCNGYGEFHFTSPLDSVNIKISATGYQYLDTTIVASEQIKITLKALNKELNQLVVTGTRTNKRQTESAVIVNVIDQKTMEAVGSCVISEALNFQPGLRVETDCQTCNYTQLRMNGLSGSYSQILINGRPIFSPLVGLYGLEQIPTSMLEKIEIVRGGGSALYGSNAIGGTVNLITKVPKNNSFEMNHTYSLINLQSPDLNSRVNATLISKNKQLATTIFTSYRNRKAWDANNDGFSELPLLKNYAFGTNLVFQPSEKDKFELNFSFINEYRYGGQLEMNAPHLANQAEERTHDVFTVSGDYQINFNEQSSLIIFAGAQHTDRVHYTGITPDDSLERTLFNSSPPYGNSNNETVQGGVQWNQKTFKKIGLDQVFTAGYEILLDRVYDIIPSYQYKIDQHTVNHGLYLQSDWNITPKINWLLGARTDRHNLLDQWVFSPRTTLLYKPLQGLQWRANIGKGFRAPQAFDTDMHIAFAGGGISRISLSPILKPESSLSYSTSINYDYTQRKYTIGTTIEAFTTRLIHPFYLHPLGWDGIGERFEKRNGRGAKVEGITIEFRLNFKRLIQLESGFTFQRSQFDQAILYSDEVAAQRQFLKSPNQYGYGILSFQSNRRWSGSVSYNYTGPMYVLHLSGAPEQSKDEILLTDAFHELGIKINYLLKTKEGFQCAPYIGLKNIFNQYQRDFDTGKYRDSNFIYGPALPRTIYIGIKFSL